MATRLHPTVARILAEALTRLRRRHRKRWDRAAARPTPEHVHQLRVETRRLLALVELLRSAGVGDGVRKLRRSLKRRLDDFDPLRDLHICRERLAALRDDVPDRDALLELWTQREQTLSRELAGKLTSKRYRKLKKRLSRLQTALKSMAREQARESGAGTVRTLLQPLYQQVLTRAQHARTAAQVHRLRVAFKKFRYACEMLQAKLPGLTRTELQAMRRFHTLMGELQDTVVLRQTWQTDAPRAGVPPTRVRQVDRLLHEQQRQLLTRCRAAIAQVTRWEPSRLAQRRRS